MEKSNVKNLTLTAMFLALGIILPFFTGQIPQIGAMLLPMHIPVFLCALVCGWQYGVPMAVLLPLIRTVLFGRPNFYPEAIAIAWEMGTYALVAGYLYGHARWQCIRSLYRCLLLAMVAGRVVRCLVQLALLGLGGIPISLGALFTGVILAGLPGILLQLILIPTVMLLFHRTKMVPFRHGKNHGMEHHRS